MIHQFFFYSGIVFWASILFCCALLFILRVTDDHPLIDVSPDEKRKFVREHENESSNILYLTEEPKIINEYDNEFSITLEKYLDGEAKTTQYE